ncbi:hypothetical protein BAUCODRAFT_535860 [Baudoinia panamericana UAMH 10762]|uniref:Uncharacterized protein n=1 Tax=Baudoinia panamericana (strain UAMH 10762) TaxID=717646 RepID=M2MUR1_BAUPA|nr:uncharacterized protein BAUCODRAFT_535860 [Baudoinia panamericana UAMH 10762]EMC95313.1 hypothetical protein BAUCODRAFT_535860 [Baudoinia panamericana UAMH 10762]
MQALLVKLLHVNRQFSREYQKLACKHARLVVQNNGILRVERLQVTGCMPMIVQTAVVSLHVGPHERRTGADDADALTDLFGEVRMALPHLKRLNVVLRVEQGTPTSMKLREVWFEGASSEGEISRDESSEGESPKHESSERASLRHKISEK